MSTYLLENGITVKSKIDSQKNESIHLYDANGNEFLGAKDITIRIEPNKPIIAIVEFWVKEIDLTKDEVEL